MSTAYFNPSDCRLHDMGSGHPECPARLDAIENFLQSTGLLPQLTRMEAPLVDWSEVQHAHTEAYAEQIRTILMRLQAQGACLALDPDTRAGPGTWRAVQRALGAAVAATDAVIDGQFANAFCAVRPPGHHATSDQAMGFCFVNSLAVAARHALEVRGLSRVAIVDFDVHHGNGTEDIVAGDDRILMVSIFQQALYPYCGSEPLGGNTLNIGLPRGTLGPEIRDIIRASWLPRLEAFKPQMIFISAGFDAHRDDPLGQLGLIEADYEWITQQIKQVAQRHAAGRIVSCLEGGYELGALARSVAAHLRVLADISGAVGT